MRSADPGAPRRIYARGCAQVDSRGQVWGDWGSEAPRVPKNWTDWTQIPEYCQILVLKMFQNSNKKCFTIEALVGKDASGSGSGSGSGLGDEPIRPTALRFPDSLHPASAAGVFGSCFQGSGGRTLFCSGPDVVLQEPGGHAQGPGPGGLPLHPLQIPPQSFFGPQHRDPLGFYPWVLRNRFLGHRFQGEPRVLVRVLVLVLVLVLFEGFLKPQKKSLFFCF